MSPPPRIGLDLLCLKGERTGMGWNAWSLAAALPRVAPDLRFLFFLPPGVEAPSNGGRLPDNVEIVRVPVGGYRGARVVAEQWNLARAAERSRPDLFHTIAYGPPVLYRGLKVLTIHDLAFKLFPDTAPLRYRAYWNWAYGSAARDCRRIIAVSESTRADILRLLGRDPATVSVVHHGVDPAYFPAGEVSADSPGGLGAARGPATLERFGITRPYIFNVGTIQPRKDFVTLLKTFARIRTAVPDLELVVAGGKGWGYGDPVDVVRAHGLAGHVRLLDYVSIGALPDLYRGAALFLFTSIYEGFGFPPLEAMASGTPVVTTSSSSIPEVVGDAALTAPVGDSEALAEHALRLLHDPALRDELVRRGLERARLFTWRNAAEKTADVYRSVLKKSPT